MKRSKPSKIVIVGAGECGAMAAVHLRELSFDGELVLMGNETLATYERPPLSKAALTETEDPQPATAVSEQRLRDLEVELVLGDQVTEIDRANDRITVASGRHYSYDRLLLATGARARPLPEPLNAQTITLRTYGDALAVRSFLRPGASIVVIGAGFIGLEVASSAATRACAVTVLETAPQVLGRGVPVAIAERIAERHRQGGVTIRCGVTVREITANGAKRTVVLGTGESIEADLVVAGIGAMPNTELASSAGLAIENGIRVDACLQTSDPQIYAAGDCCSFPHALFNDRRIRLESWRNAHDHAAVAATNMLGGQIIANAVPWFWSDQFDLGLQVAGLSDEAAQEIVRTRSDGHEIRFGIAADGRLVSASAVAPGTAIAKDIRLAEKLIAQRNFPDIIALADPNVPLKNFPSLHGSTA